jgi:hypothetical protein
MVSILNCLWRTERREVCGLKHRAKKTYGGEYRLSSTHSRPWHSEFRDLIHDPAAFFAARRWFGSLEKGKSLSSCRKQNSYSPVFQAVSTPTELTKLETVWLRTTTLPIQQPLIIWWYPSFHWRFIILVIIYVLVHFNNYCKTKWDPIKCSLCCTFLYVLYWPDDGQLAAETCCLNVNWYCIFLSLCWYIVVF